MTPTTERTRRAILDAAAAVLARDPSAALSEVAAAAGVGRTTLHRHYPDRAGLVRALALDAFAASAAACEQSRLEDGSALDALARLVHELLRLGDRFAFLLREPAVVADPEIERAEAEAAAPILTLVARGQATGELRADLPASWMVDAIGSLVYGAWIAVDAGTLPRADAPRLVLATLTGGIAARAAPRAAL